MSKTIDDVDVDDKKELKPEDEEKILIYPSDVDYEYAGIPNDSPLPLPAMTPDEVRQYFNVPVYLDATPLADESLKMNIPLMKRTFRSYVPTRPLMLPFNMMGNITSKASALSTTGQVPLNEPYVKMTGIHPIRYTSIMGSYQTPWIQVTPMVVTGNLDFSGNLTTMYGGQLGKTFMKPTGNRMMPMQYLGSAGLVYLRMPAYNGNVVSAFGNTRFGDNTLNGMYFLLNTNGTTKSTTQGALLGYGRTLDKKKGSLLEAHAMVGRTNYSYPMPIYSLNTELMPGYSFNITRDLPRGMANYLTAMANAYQRTGTTRGSGNSMYYVAGASYSPNRHLRLSADFNSQGLPANWSEKQMNVTPMIDLGVHLNY